MKIAILGTGFGYEHAKIFNSFPDVEIIGIFGRNAKKLDEIHANLNIPIYTDIDSLISHPEVDLIDIVLPTVLHKKYVIQALHAGKHVFVETPLALNIEDAKEMQEVAQKQGKEIFVGLFMLFSPEFRYVLDLLPKDSFGKIHSVFLSRRTPRIWGDMNPMILNLMIHDFDYIYGLLGMPNSLSARQEKARSHAGEQIFVELFYDNCNVVIEGSSLCPASYPFSLTLRVNGEHEMIEIVYPFNDNFEICHVVHYPVEGKNFTPSMQYENEYKIECRYVIDYLAKKTTSRINQIEIAIKSLQMALSAQKSYENKGKTIYLEN